MRKIIAKLVMTTAMLAVGSIASAEIKGPMPPGAYLQAEKWKDGPVCVHRSIYKNDSSGRYASIDITEEVAFWFGSGSRETWFAGRAAPKATNNGTPIEFFLSDANFE